MSFPLIWPAAMLTIALIVSGFLVFAAGWQGSEAENAWLTAQRLLATNRRQLGDARLEKAAIEEDILNLRRWQEQGLIGKENRLLWVETVHQAARSVGIRDIRFKFDARQPLGKASPPGMRWYVSTLHLTIRKIDEVRLLRFLQQIESEANRAVTRIRRCDLKLAPGEDNEAPSLDAECALDWLTIDQGGER